MLNERLLRDRRASRHPGEDFRKSIPEVIEWRKDRELVGQHVRPHGFKGLPMWCEAVESRYSECLISTFLPYHIEEDGGCGAAVRVAIKVHDVVKIAGSCPFSECPQLFAESLLVRVAIC